MGFIGMGRHAGALSRPGGGRAIAFGRGLHLAPLAGRGRRALARRVRGPLRESERVESLRPSPRPSPRKSGAREQKARGHLMLAPMGAALVAALWAAALQCGRAQGPPLRNAFPSNLMTHMTSAES